MAEMDEEVLDGLEDEESEEESDDEELDADAVPDEESDEEDEDEKPVRADKSEKRVRDLQSKLDKALAENSKLKKSNPSGVPTGKEADPEVQQWVQAAMDVTRNQIYSSDPRFKEFGVPPSAIAGDTPEQMQTSAAETLRFVNRIVTRTTNKVLREHGFSPEPKGDRKESSKDFDNMSQKEFDAQVRKALGGY